MGRLYTFDKKLLCGAPELRLGDKVYSIDDRKNTVRKALELFRKNEKDNSFDTYDEILKLAFGGSFAEINKMDLSFAAYQELVITAIAAMTGQDEKELKKEDSSFQ